MKVPLSWLREYAALPESVAAGEVAARLTAVGLEVESVVPFGRDVRGVVVAEVRDIEELTGYRKPVRYCRVTVGRATDTADGSAAHGSAGGRDGTEGAVEDLGVVCGAANFVVGDRVAFARPGATLPGGVRIDARSTYGHKSEGMICSTAELGIGGDAAGILVLPQDAPLGVDVADYAGLVDDVLDVAVTPDRGYCASVRGIARELASAFGVAFTDPGAGPAPAGGSPGTVPPWQYLDQAWDATSPDVRDVAVDDPGACDRFVLREVRGVDPAAPTPLWITIRLARCGVRSVSLAVDVTNYLTLELGQPLHAFDAAKVRGAVVVRRAREGERLETLDHVTRRLDPDDVVITDESGPISLAGTMGGLATEIDAASRDLIIEAAHFSATATARMSRRHRLRSEASYRFERGVDRELPLPASAKAAALLATFGGGTVVAGCTHVSADVPPVTIPLPADYPERVSGVIYGRETVTLRLREVGCAVQASRSDPVTGRHDRESHERGRHDRGRELLSVVAPSWRPDLTDPADLAEEVIRLEGYENIPVRRPRAFAGHGLTARQRMYRAVGRALAGSGYVEVLGVPFSSAADAAALRLPPEDERRRTIAVANPLNDDEPLLRTTLLPGLFRVLARNVGRGRSDVALFEAGLVFLARPGGRTSAPQLPVDRVPDIEQIAALDAALPDQPLHVALVTAGNAEPAGWWGPGRPACWTDAVEAAQQVGRTCRVPLDVRADGRAAPWHPGRCAALFARGGSDGERWLAGYAGELHPRVVEAFGLPDRTCAAELDMSVLFAAASGAGPVQAPALSVYPSATQDVALTVDESVAAADVRSALVDGAVAHLDGDLLEDVRLFDVYTGQQLGAGRKSLAYTLRFRAVDRTLTVAETSAARGAAVAEAARRLGAVLRGP